MTRSTLFKNNKTQAVRLPKAVAFPDDVHEVEIVKRGQIRIISPIGRRWDEFFLHVPNASQDFMSNCMQPAAEERELL